MPGPVLSRSAPLPRSRGETPIRSVPSSTPPPLRAGRRLACWVARGAVLEVPRVRASLRRTLESWGVGFPCVETLLLVGTELLSNAVRHAGAEGGRPRVTVVLAGGRLRLDVADGDPRLPRFARGVGPGAGLGVDVDAEGGRGLAIVSFLVDEAGGELAAFRAAAGKVVRVCVPVI
ncbi:ATP-binding protein [Streptomyces narbonensis]|uniref:ATP-binding protein n=1 Tax=Streptomyces narbonensis TaxID=67333 RepID=A0ABV3C9C6_9ACTN